MTALRQAIELARRIWRSWARLLARERNRRAGWSGRECCWRTERTHRFLRWRRAWGVHHQTVQRCVERALAYGPIAALDDRPRPGKEPTITAEAKAWVVNLACRKAKELGYPHELWTTRLLARHARDHGPAEGHTCLAKLAQGTLCNILNGQEIKPHKVRYYLERRDPQFQTENGGGSVRLSPSQAH